MDTLTFNSPILLRHLTFSEARKEPILEVRLDAVLEGLEMELPQVKEPIKSEKLIIHLYDSLLNFAYCLGVIIWSRLGE